jgi:hypothetical protein
VATQVLAAGGSLVEARELLGHSHTDVTSAPHAAGMFSRIIQPAPRKGGRMISGFILVR